MNMLRRLILIFYLLGGLAVGWAAPVRTAAPLMVGGNFSDRISTGTVSKPVLFDAAARDAEIAEGVWSGRKRICVQTA